MTDGALEAVERVLAGLGALVDAAVNRRVRRWGTAMTVGFVLLAGAFGLLYASAQSETTDRVDQICTLFETDHLNDVKQLRGTYRYLLALSPSERKSTINRFVLAGLPEQEKQAQTDSAPEFCDEPNVGLKEPDPVVPKRPPGLRP